MKYTYVLLCSDGKHYVGCTTDLKKRFERHSKGVVTATKHRLPVKLVYYEACLSIKKARGREKYFKTVYGRRYIKSRI